MSKVERFGLILGMITGASITSARADSIDIPAFLTRFDPSLPVTTLFGLVALFALVNYLVNFLVIGWPAIKLGSTSLGPVAFGLALLTLLGQLADRSGAYASLYLERPITRALHLRSGDSWVLVLLLTNFAISGIVVAAVSLYFLRRWWKVPGWQALVVALLAAVITNPTWIIMVPWKWLA